MTPKIKNAKKIVRAGTRYPNDVRMAIELDQGYQMTAAQDIALEQMAAEGKVTVKEAVERLMQLRPKSRVRA